MRANTLAIARLSASMSESASNSKIARRDISTLPSKVSALRNLTYNQIISTLGINTRFELEVDDLV